MHLAIWNISRLATPFFVAISICGCATQVRVDPILLANQDRIYRDGVPTVISRKGVVVMLSPVSVVREGKERSRFVVSVSNTTQRPFEIDTTNLSASIDGKPIRIYTYEEIAQQIKTRQAWAAFATAAGGAMEAASVAQTASNTYTSGSYKSNTSGSYQSETAEKFSPYGARVNTVGSYKANTTGSYSESTYNPGAGQAAAAAVNAKTEAEMASLQAQGQAELNDASRTLLKMTTVFPGSSHGGQIVLAEFDIPESGAVLDLRFPLLARSMFSDSPNFVSKSEAWLTVEIDARACHRG